MGGRNSREGSSRQTPSVRSNSSSWSRYQPPYGQENYNYPPQESESYSSPQYYPSSKSMFHKIMAVGTPLITERSWRGGIQESPTITIPWSRYYHHE
jgi:hypothetical protein